MRTRKKWLAVAAVWCVGIAVPRFAAADTWNRETVVTFSQDVQIPGKVLRAGKYIFRIADSPDNRHVVQVFDPAGNILATVFTIPVNRPSVADDTRISFERRPTPGPVPIKSWFYPGNPSGEEFIYRKPVG